MKQDNEGIRVVLDLLTQGGIRKGSIGSPDPTMRELGSIGSPDPTMRGSGSVGSPDPTNSIEQKDGRQVWLNLGKPFNQNLLHHHPFPCLPSLRLYSLFPKEHRVSWLDEFSENQKGGR